MARELPQRKSLKVGGISVSSSCARIQHVANYRHCRRMAVLPMHVVQLKGY